MCMCKTYVITITMVMCWAPDCKHYNVKQTCTFFRIPKDSKTRRKWLKLLRRDDEPGPGTYICSCHFVEGKKENGPTLFLHNKEKRMSFPSPQKRKRSVILADRTNVAELSDPQDVTDEPSTSKQTAAPPLLSPVVVEAENYFLQQDIGKASEQLQYLYVRFSFEHISNNNNLVMLYTGIPTSSIFLSLFNLLKNIQLNYYYNWKVDKITKEDQLLMTLMKLRQNFPHGDLGVRFNVSQATVSNIVTTWIHVLHDILFKQLMSNIPDRTKNQLCLPNCFSTYTNCRVILDCTEIYTEVSRTSLATQKKTYSSYKHRNTWKVLIGVAPNGVVTYVSNLYGGSNSDKKIVMDCGILDQLQVGDLILADKGFLIRDILPAGIQLNIPPFLTTAQFTPEQIRQTETIARARIHVERAIRRIKVFKILSLIPHSLLQHANAVCQVTAALTNLQYPLIKEVQQYFNDE